MVTFSRRPTQDVIQSGAGYAEVLGRFGLIPTLFLHGASNLNNELSAQFHIFRIGDAHVLEEVAAGTFHLDQLTILRSSASPLPYY